MTISAVKDRIIPAAKETGGTAMKGAGLGAAIGLPIAAYFHYEQKTMALPALNWISYLRIGLAKYTIIPVFATAGVLTGTAYGIYKLNFKKQF